ncbi:MAG: hypothetical protein HC806_04875 [Anaerolineae bacterium]|nr:hypothetical protein [Anaerolineae bacterium]
MKKSLYMTGGLVLLAVIAVTAWVLRPPAEATEPIEAIPLENPTTTGGELTIFTMSRTNRLSALASMNSCAANQ